MDFTCQVPNFICYQLLISQVSLSIPGPSAVISTVIWEDNRSTILIAENECSSAWRSKHIDIRYKFVAQTIAENIVHVRYTPTDTNLADILTKVLSRATFERLRALCQGNKWGNYYVDAMLEHERVMCMCDSNTWMTTSVYSDMVSVI